MPDVLTTNPYYRSAYVFVSRADRNLHIRSLNDPRLSDLRIGIHVAGDNYAPPAYALARRGITRNIVGFSLFGAYGDPSPARKLIDAVDRGDVDVALVWGPIAGYFAHSAQGAGRGTEPKRNSADLAAAGESVVRASLKSTTAPLEINVVTPLTFLGVPFAYDISAAVRSDNFALKTELDQALASHSAVVQRLLSEYGFPQVP
jgi:ABC-type amino acid transport substrate-binding protein